MRNSLTDLSKSKDLKRKGNNRKNGKRDKKLELIYFIKYSMTEKEKLDNIKRLKNSNLDKNSLTKFKFRKESTNTSLNNKLVVKRNTRDRNYSKENCCNRSHKSNKKEDSSCYSFRGKNSKCSMQDKITARRYNKENVKGDNNYKISKKLPDCFD